MLLGNMCLLPCADTVSFSGGDAERLVRSLARQDVAPVAVFADANERMRSFLGVPRSELSPSRLRAESRLGGTGDTLSLASSKLPGGFLYRQALGAYLNQFGSFASLKSEGGRISLAATGPAWVRVGDLAALKLSKPLRLHRVWQDAVVAVTPGAFDEEALLQTVGAALGAKYVSNERERRFDFDPASHRTRALARFKNSAWQVDLPGFEDTRTLALAALPLVTDRDWTAAYETSSTQYVKRGIPADSAPCIQARKTFRAALDQIRMRQPTQYNIGLSMLDKLDPKGLAQLRLYADGRIDVDMPYYTEPNGLQGYLSIG